MPHSLGSLTGQIVFYGSYHILPDFWLISWHVPRRDRSRLIRPGPAASACSSWPRSAPSSVRLALLSVAESVVRIRLKRSAVDTSRLALQMAPTSRCVVAHWPQLTCQDDVHPPDRDRRQGKVFGLSSRSGDTPGPCDAMYALCSSIDTAISPLPVHLQCSLA